ncbi:MAG: PssD/Cps14F family polysaccharide biosynthesis glycosyltransferase [Bacilli bacterium]|jgi:beta-1,4-N-acetylglucosaminyltransferase|nr:polysaccharide biosynthesis protein [Bacilli bacterium]
MAKRILLMATSSGSLFTLLQLKDSFNKYDFYIVTSKNDDTVFMKQYYGKRLRFLNDLTTEKGIFSFLYNYLKSCYFLVTIRPHIIIMTESPLVVLICYTAKLWRRKVIFITSFSNIKTLSLVGRLVYPIADLFIVQWRKILKKYPKAIYGGWLY